MVEKRYDDYGEKGKDKEDQRQQQQQQQRRPRNRRAALCAQAAISRQQGEEEEPAAATGSSSAAERRGPRAPILHPEEQIAETKRKRKASAKPFQDALSRHLERVREARFLLSLVRAAPGGGAVESKFACPICQCVRTAYRDCDRCHSFVCGTCARSTRGTRCSFCRAHGGMAGKDRPLPLKLTGLAEATVVGCAYCGASVAVSEWKEHLGACRRLHCEGCGQVSADAKGLREHTARCPQALAYAARGILRQSAELHEENKLLKARLEKAETTLEAAGAVSAD